jgi:hypothetical protein
MLKFTPEQLAAIEAACAQHLEDCRNYPASSDGPAVSNDREPTSVIDQLKRQLFNKARADLIRQVIERAVRDTASVHWRIGEGPEEGGQLVRVRDLLTWAEQTASELEAQFLDPPTTPKL